MKEVDFHFIKPEESSGFLLWQVTMLWQRKIKQGLDEIDLTHTQFVLLASSEWLFKQHKIVTQIDISNHSKTDRMMVSKVLRTLQQKELVTRHEHKTDTRAKTILLTSKGKLILQKALVIVGKIDTDFFKILNKDLKNYNNNMQKLLTKN